MHTCSYAPYGGVCWIGMAAGWLAWLLISSGLLYLTWNRVLILQTKLKPIKLWHAILTLGTILVIFAPCSFLHRGHSGHHGMMGMHSGGCCHHDGDCKDGKGDCKDSKGDCPYESEKADAKKK